MKRIPWLLIGWAGSLAVAPIVWWLVGDVSESLGEERTWAAPEWLVDNTHRFGVYGLIAVCAVAILAAIGLQMHQIGRQTVAAFLPLVAAAAVAASGYRVTTSFVHGAETRSVVVLFLGVPMVAALAAIHLGWLRADLRRMRGY